MRIVLVTNMNFARELMSMASAISGASNVKTRLIRINRISLIGTPRMSAATEFFAAAPLLFHPAICMPLRGLRSAAGLFMRNSHSIQPSVRLTTLYRRVSDVRVIKRTSRTHEVGADNDAITSCVEDSVWRSRERLMHNRYHPICRTSDLRRWRSAHRHSEGI